MLNSLSPAGFLLLFIFLTGLILFLRALWEIRQLVISRTKISLLYKESDPKLKLNPNACQTRRVWQAICLPAYRVKKNRKNKARNNSRQAQVQSKIRQPQSENKNVLKQFRIMQLSDIHADHLYVSMTKLKQAVEAEKPDLLVFTGDLTGRDSHLDKGLAFLKKFRQEICPPNLRMVAVAGNHDTPETILGMKALGIEVLENESLLIETETGPIAIIGLEDLRNGFPDFTTAVKQLSVSDAFNRQVCPPAFHLVLAHNPDTIFYLPERAADLVITGHFHGGQIWMPFRFEFIMLREEKLPKMAITRGLNFVRNMPLYISRGLGCVSIPLRLFSLPELAIFDITSENTYHVDQGE